MTHRYLDRVYLREPVPAGSYLADCRQYGLWETGSIP